jgi:hypothetical protein
MDAAAQSGGELIGRCPPEGDASYSLAKWIFKDSEIVGVHIECKVRLEWFSDYIVAIEKLSSFYCCCPSVCFICLF